MNGNSFRIWVLSWVIELTVSGTTGHGLTESASAHLLRTNIRSKDESNAAILKVGEFFWPSFARIRGGSKGYDFSSYYLYN